MRLLHERKGVLLSAAIVCFLFAALARAQNSAKSDTPKIVVHSIEVSSLGEIDRNVSKLNGSTCSNSPSSKPLTVADLAGGKVKTIRVVRVQRLSTAPKAKELKRVLQKVWQGRVDGAACGIEWSEVSFWSIETVLKFQDGKRGSLITDGSHIALQDHDGRVWFTRLLPAAK